jgi:hypothetical protein
MGMSLILVKDFLSVVLQSEPWALQAIYLLPVYDYICASQLWGSLLHSEDLAKQVQYTVLLYSGLLTMLLNSTAVHACLHSYSANCRCACGWLLVWYVRGLVNSFFF